MSENNTDPRGVNTNLSYFTIRSTIGWAGLLLPICLPAIARIHSSDADYYFQSSISHYYYTVSGILFIGFVMLIGVFLISYRGYEKEQDETFSDNLITWVGGVLVLIVAIVPTSFEAIDVYRPTPIAHNDPFWGRIHFGSAVGFFLAMAYLSIVKFTRGNKPLSDPKKNRNKVYRFCGWGMIVTLAVGGILIFRFCIDERWESFIFWLEVVLLVLFGVSWLVKGKDWSE